MNFEITKGNPTPAEIVAIQSVLTQLKPEELRPTVRRSVYGLPQLRAPLAHQINFGARRFS